MQPTKRILLIGCLLLLAAAAGGARYLQIGPFAPPPPPPWWVGSWRSEAGRGGPDLDLATRQRSVIGQLISDFTGGYRISQAVLAGETSADGEMLLLTVEPRAPATLPEADPRLPPLPNFAPRPAPPDPPLYLLIRRGEGRAELFQLKDPPGEARVVRPLGSTSRPIVFPTEPEKFHTRVATLVRVEEGGRR